MQITPQQKVAIESAGNVIVSASAGSGKTFVMIQKLVSAIESGVDLDSVLAVTFTKKAAAQMKEKLRTAIIARMEGADAEKKARLKIQLSKIPSASISTIHAFCARLIRTYFYTAGVDGTFGIISADDAQAREFKMRAVDGLFERYYAEDDENFKHLLKCYRKKRSDFNLKALILSNYEKLRINADYLKILDSAKNLYTEEGFKKVSEEFYECAKRKYIALENAVIKFENQFKSSRPEYAKIFSEMRTAIKLASASDIFQPLPPLSVTRKPLDKTDDEKIAGLAYKAFREDISARYKAVRGDLLDEQTEREYFLKSGRTAVAFSEVLKQFDAEYTAIKRDENKLDYNDLEHLTLFLLNEEKVRKEINSKYTCVFVDEYQDVNPVQEEIISRIGGQNVFLVGDVKQAIYGFRGSKSLFFAEKYNSFGERGGTALRLSSNFRSSDGVINFVNSLFSGIMTNDTCGFDYSAGSSMLRGGGYPEDFGSTQIHIFGKDEEEKQEPTIYSVKSGGRGVKHTREGLAVLEIIKRELQEKHFDLKSGEYVDTQPGDICILTRKRGAGTAGIVKALTDAGYSVAGAQESDIRTRPEVKQMIDILSYLDNAEQDIPLATSLLSPLGGLGYNDLAVIRVFNKGGGRMSFRDCCKIYAQRRSDDISLKLKRFFARIEKLRDLAEIFTSAEVIDKILEITGLEAVYSACGGEKLKNVRRLSAEGENLSVSALLAKLKEGYEITAPAPASSESIKIMTMHASKGLEFPVVIISDICAGYKGRDLNELYFDEQFGFAPKYFDCENMLVHSTILRRLAGERASREELKNEYNLFYVACTRAMCRLHIMAKEANEFNMLDLSCASSYSKMFDISAFNPEYMPTNGEIERSEKLSLISSPDDDLKQRIESRFMQEYAWANSINLPVKSSASAILKLTDAETYFRPHELFSGEGETGTDRGTAYHRFLELCDFNLKTKNEITDELNEFLNGGLISAGQFELLEIDNLVEILNMPVFASIAGGVLFREQEFLCRLPANALFETPATDGVLVQGAIDLLVKKGNKYHIIDYKYSHKTDEQLIATYSRQLFLYRKAVALIAGVDESDVSTAIVNIFQRRQIILN